MNLNKNAASAKAIAQLKAKKELPQKVKLQQNNYLNNLVEQDYRRIKRLTRPGMQGRLTQHDER